MKIIFQTFKLMFVLLFLMLSVSTGHASLGEGGVRCKDAAGNAVDCASGGGALRNVSEDEGEAANIEAPEAVAPEAEPETSSEEPAVEAQADDAGADEDDSSENSTESE